MARFSLIPKDGRFFDDFIQLAQEIRKAAAVLVDMLAGDVPRWAAADELKALEHECDQVAHDALHRLNKTFVTPLDREDIHTLILYLDNVMDMIDAAGGCPPVSRPERPPRRPRAGRVILRSTEQILLATQKLEQRRGIDEHIVEINRLENEADRVHRRAVGRLFDGGAERRSR